MAINTSISWCDHTINFWWGCEKVSAGCKNCYAATLSHRFGDDIWGHGKPRRWIKSAEATARNLNDRAQKLGVRYRVFCQSMSDFFEDDHGQPIIHLEKMWDALVPEETIWVDAIGPCTAARAHSYSSRRLCTLTDLRNRAFKVIDETPHLDWLLLTKRPENIAGQWCSHANTDGLPPSRLHRANAWLLTSVEDQATANKRIPELLKCHDLSPVLGLSMEPLLGPVDLTKVDNHDGTVANLFDGNCLYVGEICGIEYAWTPRNLLNWVIVGGESGPGFRVMPLDALASIAEQCSAARVPLFVKQDSGPKSGQQGRLSDRLWGLKEFPR